MLDIPPERRPTEAHILFHNLPSGRDPIDLAVAQLSGSKSSSCSINYQAWRTSLQELLRMANNCQDLDVLVALCRRDSDSAFRTRNAFLSRLSNLWRTADDSNFRAEVNEILLHCKDLGPSLSMVAANAYISARNNVARHQLIETIKGWKAAVGNRKEHNKNSLLLTRCIKTTAQLQDTSWLDSLPEAIRVQQTEKFFQLLEQCKAEFLPYLQPLIACLTPITANEAMNHLTKHAAGFPWKATSELAQSGIPMSWSYLSWILPQTNPSTLSSYGKLMQLLSAENKLTLHTEVRKLLDSRPLPHVLERGLNAIAALREITDQSVKAVVAAHIIYQCQLSYAGFDGKLWSHARTAELLREFANNDHVPYPSESSEADKMRYSIREGTAAMLSIHLGFPWYTMAARRIVPNEPHLLARFGLETGADVEFINASSPEKIPGCGVSIKGLALERFFPRDSSKPTDPFWRVKESLASIGAEKALDIFPETQFIFTRHQIIIVPPSGAKLILNKRRALVVYNEHFLNTDLDVGALLSLDVLGAQLHDTLASSFDASARNWGDLVSGYSDICERDFSPSGHKEVAKLFGEHYIDVGSGSCLGGSFSNAFQAQSKPYYDWESSNLHNHPWGKDRWGHVHKSHRLMYGNDTLTDDLKKALEPLVEAHWQNHAAIMENTRLFTIFRLANSLYHMGFTLDHSDQKFDSAAGIGSGIFRLLRWGYDCRTALSQQNASDDKYPVIAVPDIMFIGRQFIPHVTWDTRTMEVRVRDESGAVCDTFNLPDDSNGRGWEEEELWATRVAPYFKWGRDVRPFHREDLSKFI